ncbi:MlaD family protein [Polaribacter sp.]|nr:MlaD family protein [Polaribacter sp.]
MSKELKIGIVSLIAIGCFIWGFNFLKGQNILDPNIRFFKVEYERIGDLTKSSAVTIHGLRVGRVEDIEFNEDPKKRGELVVRFSVEKDFPFSKNSVVKIYSPSPLGGSNLAIIPEYEGTEAVSGDTLPGQMETGLFTTIGERLDPLQTKLESVIVKADTLFSGINNVLDKNTVDGVNNSVTDISIILSELKTAITRVNSMLAANEGNLSGSLENTKKITDNLNRLTDSLSSVDFSNMVRTAELTLNNFKELSQKMNSTDGTLGKFMNDPALYDNLNATSIQLEQLVEDLKLNPKRYVHFSVFGKKQKEYEPEKED